MAETCGDDLCVWPDDTVCYADDLGDFLAWKSDDFERVPFGTARWEELRRLHEGTE